MRHPFIITLISVVGLMGCNAKARQEKKNDRCEAARAASAAAWTNAAQGWGKMHDQWADARLVEHVRSQLLGEAKLRPDPVEDAKLPATMKRFDEFVQYKLRLCDRARLGAEKARKYARGELAVALLAAEQAADRTFDLSGVRPEQPAWNKVKQVDDVEKAMERAKAETTNAQNLTKAIGKVCPK